MSDGAGASVGVEPRRPAARDRQAGEAAHRRRWTWRTQLWVVVAGWLIAAVLRLLYLTLRVRLIDPDDALGLRRGEGPILIAFWHDSIVLMPLLARRLRWPRPLRVLLSWHRDAEIAARAIAHLGIASARGSSTRGWVGGLRGLLEAHGRGEDLIVVPDGPRGPRHQAKDGVIQVARATGRRVVVLGAAGWPVRRLGSWDRLQLPLPFARVVVVAGGPLTVARRADADVMARACADLQAALTVSAAAARAAAGAPAA